MSNAVTGFEGMLASRVLGSMADEHEEDVTSSTRLEAEIDAYKKALHVGKRRQQGKLVVTTTAKDERTSSGIVTTGSMAFGGWITTGAELDVIVSSAVEQFSGGLSAIEYLETVQAYISDYVSHIKQSPVVSVQWLDDASQELQDALDDEDVATLATDEKTTLLEVGRSVLDEAVSVDVEAPAIDLDPQGNLNFFWRRDTKGLLVVVRSDRTIHFFGSSDGDCFRADYGMNGKTWRTHLNFYLQPFRSDDAT